jgi:uncharacterized membrane protein YfcA
MDWLGYISWVLAGALFGAWYARRQNRDRLDAATTSASYALLGAFVGGLLALAILFLGWITD